MDEIEIFTLGNGIRCVYRSSSAPIAYISLSIGAGTRDESPSEHGVAHLVEHLMFKGTARRTAYKISSTLESVGGELNAFTTKEDTVINAICPVEYTSQAVDLLQDMAFNSTFALSEIDKERSVIIDEINSYKDSPSELIFDDFEELLFKGSGLGRNILGSKRALNNIKQSDIVDFTTRNYRADNIVVAASTSMPIGKFKSLCDKYLGGVVSSSSAGERVAPNPIQFEKIRNKRAYQTHTLLGGTAYSAYDERRLALSLALNILGGPSSLSRLNMILREKHALTYSVEASYTPFVDAGLYSLYFTTEEAKTEKAQKLLTSEIEKLCSTPIKAPELERWKRQFIGQLLLSNQNIEQFMISIAKSVLLYGKCESNEQIIGKIKSVTSEQILDVAQDIFRADNISKLTYH